MFKQIIIPITLFFMIACGEKPNKQEKFLANYQEFCGYAYEGKATINEISSGGAFENVRLIMILETCEDDLIRMPFYVGSDHSRTWVIQMKDGHLHLSHDHRYEDGSQHEANFYGGYSDDRGTDFKQYFPADEQTIKERPGRLINTWSKAFDIEGGNYFYRLYQNDVLRFEVVFDLTNQLPID